MTAAESPVAAYEPGAITDEAFLPDGEPRPHYASVLDQLAATDLRALRERVTRRVAETGCSFGSEPFVIDPVPRILTADEWAVLAAGVRQRARALEAFAHDLYGERRSVGTAVPERVLAGAGHLEPGAEELAAATYVGVGGFDLVRDGDGTFRVLEDNLRTPSGPAYVLTARHAVAGELDLPECLDPSGPVRDLLLGALRAAAPGRGGGGEPDVVLLSDGEANTAWWEHRRLAELLEVPVVTLGELALDGDRLVRRAGERRIGVDVVYRRTNEDRLRAPDGSPTAVGELLERPLRRGAVACVNAFGAGVGDDKLVYPYVPELIRTLLGEEPLLGQIRTYDLLDEQDRARALDGIQRLVVKPRDEYGGRGVTICPHARPEDVRAAARAIADAPGTWIAQECVVFSRHPTVVGGRLEPRHVDLRPFAVVAGGAAEVVPGGLTRVALAEDALVVNSSQGGGAKDTVVLA